ncbi:MAG: C10 family peptidase [Bacteroidetes bacterium]|nr:C10 family peptidase [Bacteroidota bacterium]
MFRNGIRIIFITRYIFRDSTGLDWDSILVANLDAGKPMYYAGWSDDSSFTSGHAFVCDGYMNPGYYHFNWGWSGSLDGFFYTSSLTPGSAQFTYAQEVICDIYPDTLSYIFPEGCSGTGTLTNISGTLNDGSHSSLYRGNVDCSWVISPECSGSVSIVFDRFWLGTGDILYIHDGATASGTTLGAFTSGNPPVLSSESGSTVITASTADLFLHFVTDNDSVAEGWDVSYSSSSCLPMDTITGVSGTVDDGSGDCNYRNGSNCKWVIQPPGADSVYLNFTEFDLAPNVQDLLAVYKNSVSGANLLECFRYTDIPTVYTVPAGTCVLYFKSDYTETAGGWTVEYSKYPMSVKKHTPEQYEITVFPNPFTDDITLSVNLRIPQEVIVIITDMLGKNLASGTFHEKEGCRHLQIGRLTRGVSPGLYYVVVQNGDRYNVRKIVKKG